MDILNWSIEYVGVNWTQEAPDTIKALLIEGKHFQTRATYLCSSCHEWTVDNAFFIFEAIHVSPYGTIRDYKVHFLDSPPHCKKSGNELVYILNPRSSKNHCPKYGSDNMSVTGITETIGRD